MSLQIPGIPGRAHDRVRAPAAEGKFDHMGFAQVNHAGPQQAL